MARGTAPQSHPGAGAGGRSHQRSLSKALSRSSLEGLRQRALQTGSPWAWQSMAQGAPRTKAKGHSLVGAVLQAGAAGARGSRQQHPVHLPAVRQHRKARRWPTGPDGSVPQPGAPGFEWHVRKDQRPLRPNVGDTWRLPGNHVEDVHALGRLGAGLAMNTAGTSVLASPGVSRRGPLARPPMPQSGMPRGGGQVGKEGDTGSRERLEQCPAHTSS